MDAMLQAGTAPRRRTSPPLGRRRRRRTRKARMATRGRLGSRRAAGALAARRVHVTSAGTFLVLVLALVPAAAAAAAAAPDSDAARRDEARRLGGSTATDHLDTDNPEQPNEFQQTHWDSPHVQRLVRERLGPEWAAAATQDGAGAWARRMMEAEEAVYAAADADAANDADNVHNDDDAGDADATLAERHARRRLKLTEAAAAQGAADTPEERGRFMCEPDACPYGVCVFSGCRNPVTCTGGKCVFVDCNAPTCEGGLCRFIGCHSPTCDGGGCRFERTNTTLGHGYCTGGECSIDGVPTRNNMRNWLAQ